MKTLASLLAGTALAASLHAEDPAADSAPAIDPNAAIEMVAKHYAQIAAAANLDGSGSPAPRSPRRSNEPRSGLQTSSLSTNALQPSSGVTSGALGLTAAEDWRRLFPRKEP